MVFGSWDSQILLIVWVDIYISRSKTIIQFSIFVDKFWDSIINIITPAGGVSDWGGIKNHGIWRNSRKKKLFIILQTFSPTCDHRSFVRKRMTRSFTLFTLFISWSIQYEISYHSISKIIRPEEYLRYSFVCKCVKILLRHSF